MIRMAPIRVAVLEYQLAPRAITVNGKCPALTKKTRQNAVVAPPRLKDVDLNPDVMGQEKIPEVYIWAFCVAWDDIPCWLYGRETSYNIKRYGASQSLVLDSVLPFSDKSDTGINVLLQGVELGTIAVPLHKAFLRCNLKTGPVVIGVRSSLPVSGITVLLENDLAGGRIIENPKVSEMPQMVTNEGTIKHFLELFPAFAVTRAMLRAESSTIPLEQNEA